jgi:phosphoglycolate phosphatase-like HAD superfamily hydrolase
MEWDVVLPRFAQVLTPHGCLAIASEGTLAPSWHAALLPIIQRFSTNQEYQPYNLVEELERRRLFQKQGEPKMTPVPFQQSVNSYIESFHARNGFSRHRMTKEAPSVFDEEVRKLVSPFIMCEQLAVNPQACLYVGDGSSRELTGASRVGMHAVLIRVPYEDSDDAHRLDAEEWQGSTVSALEDLLALVV